MNAFKWGLTIGAALAVIGSPVIFKSSYAIGKDVKEQELKEKARAAKRAK
jgi:hypothetical protein